MRLVRGLLAAMFRLSPLLILLGLGLSGCGNDSITDSPPIAQDTALTVDDFETATSCQSCHPDQFEQWSGSMHAYALKDPTFAALREIGQSAYINALDGACIQCHSIVARETGALPWGPYDFDALPPQVQEGVGCDVCHVVSGIRSLSNADLIFSPGATKFGTIPDPVPNVAHESEFNSLYSSSEYCGSCHDLVTGDGLQLEAVFREWRAGGFAVTGKTCNDCHMPAYQGSATPGGPVRTLHDHSMVGADLALIPFPNQARQHQLVTDMLRSALTVEADVPLTVAAGDTIDLQVRLINDLTGHNVPSGVPFIRQMWIAIEIMDGTNLIYTTGDLDANGDLKDENSAFAERDEDLFNAQGTMFRADSVKTGLTWEARYLDNPSIVAGETRPVDYRIPIPPGATGPLRVELKLRFRSFPHYVIRGLGQDALLPIPIIDMWEDSRTVAIL